MRCLTQEMLRCRTLGSKKNNFLKKHKEEQAAAAKTIINRYPKFSFEFACGNYKSLIHLDKKEKVAVINKLRVLSQQTWKEINALSKKSGFEKLDKTAFKSHPNIPAKFKDEKQMDICRTPDEAGRIIGYVEDDIFYIVWIDTKLEMYKH